MHKKKEIYPVYISKFNLNCEKQIILSMNPNTEKKKKRIITWNNYKKSG